MVTRFDPMLASFKINPTQDLDCDFSGLILVYLNDGFEILKIFFSRKVLEDMTKCQVQNTSSLGLSYASALSTRDFGELPDPTPLNSSVSLIYFVAIWLITSDIIIFM